MASLQMGWAWSTAGGELWRLARMGDLASGSGRCDIMTVSVLPGGDLHQVERVHRARATALALSVTAALVVPAWSVFDLVLEPRYAGTFIALRLLGDLPILGGYLAAPAGTGASPAGAGGAGRAGRAGHGAVRDRLDDVPGWREPAVLPAGLHPGALRQRASARRSAMGHGAADRGDAGGVRDLHQHNPRPSHDTRCHRGTHLPHHLGRHCPALTPAAQPSDRTRVRRSVSP